MADVFISYSKNHRAVTEGLARLLEVEIIRQPAGGDLISGLWQPRS